jgi:tRNA-uridine 2-sulfurtransferase
MSIVKQIKVYIAMFPYKYSQDSTGQAGGVRRLRVYVAMSGGVDSSVAAALLSASGGKKQSYDVTGVFFKPWSLSKEVSFCDWKQDRRDAMMVAAKLRIKFKTWDFSKEYGREVVKYMISSYKKGITPNPDVMCNKEIKFGLFLKKALAEGADLIATGHYARIKSKTKNQKSKLQLKNQKLENEYKLLKGIDKNKDQSYFLWTLTQEQLKYCLFPIGECIKPEVRKLARKFGLLNHAKKDSQGVCFIGQLDMKEFLKKYIKPKKGKIVLFEAGLHTQAGKTIGEHDGIYYYTIGQRHGMNIGIGGGPYFVTGKDIKKNILFVSNRESSGDLKTKEMTVGNLSWVSEMPKLPAKISIKIRYRTESVPAVLKRIKRGILSIKFNKPVRAVTPGQSAVFYSRNELIGGGVIR